MEVLFSFIGIAVRLVVSGSAYLLVDKWRATFPLHVTLAMLAMAGLVNFSPWFTEPASAVLLVLFVAAIAAAIVYRTAPRWENQVFGYATAGLGAAWVLAGYFELLSHTRLMQSLLGLLIAFTALWALDRRTHVHVKTDKELSSFVKSPTRQARAKVTDLDVLEHEPMPGIGWRRVYTWPGASNTVGDIIKNIRLLEAELGEPENTLTAERVPIAEMPGRYHSNRIEVRCIRHNPLVKAKSWDGRGATALDENIVIGTFADGREITYKLWEPGVGGFHTLAAGAARSGKSVFQKLLILKYAMGPTGPLLRRLFCDLKGGAAFLGLAPLGCWLVTDLQSAIWMLELANIECERRGHVAAKMGWENGVWQPSPEFPVIEMFFDEIASLTGLGVPRELRARALYLFSEIARKGPGIGMELRIATQEPTKEALGTTQFVTQLEWRAAFRLNQPNRVQYCLPGLVGQIDPYNISRDMRGTCYVDAGGQSRAMEARMQNVPGWAEKSIVSEAWDELGGEPLTIPGFDSLILPPGSTISEERHHAALEAFASRTLWTPAMLPNAGAPVEAPEQVEDAPTPIVIERPTTEPADAVVDAPAQIEAPVGETWQELNDAAKAWPKNTREAARYTLRAIEAYLTEFPGGVPRSLIAKALERSPSDVSAKLADLAREHRAHSDDGRWYPGPDDEPTDPEETEDS